MRVGRCRVALAVATFALGGLILPPGGAEEASAARSQPATADRASQAPSEDAALENLGACVAERNQLSVLFLIDESGSLRDTDPGAARVTAVKTALVALGLLADTEVDGTSPEVEVRFAGFAEDYTRYGDWTTIADSDTVRFLGASSEQFADRNTGFDTDYVAALDGAQADLSRRALDLTAEGGEPPCQALLWFTDGKFDIEDRDTSAERDAHGTTKFWAEDIDLGQTGGGAAAESRGRELLCSGRDGEDPLSDQLRNDEITSIGIALTGDAFAEQDEIFLDALVTGEAGGVTCGNPGPTAQGAFVSAANLTQLIFAFNEVFNEPPGTSPDEGPVPMPVCQGIRTAECTRIFQVDGGLRRFNLLVVNMDSGVSIELRGPTTADQPLILHPSEDGEGNLGSAHIAWQWASPKVVSVSADLPQEQDDWVGAWSASFVSATGEGTATSELFLFGNLQPVVPDDLEFTLADESEIPITVETEEGTPATPDNLIRDAAIVASVRQGRGDRRPVEVVKENNFSFTGTYVPPADLEARTVQLRVELTVTTTSGIVLDPVVRDFDVPVTVPPAFPTIENTELRPPSLSGNEQTSTDLTVHGSTISPGCVWVEGFETLNAPGSVEQIEVSTDPTADESNCLAVGVDEEKVIHVTFDPDGSGQGAVGGNLQARVSSDQDDRVLAIPIDTSFQMSVPAGRERWFYFALLLTLGILIPLLFLWGTKWLSAKFAPPGRIRAMALSVVVVPDRSVTRDGGDPLVLAGQDFSEILPGVRDERVRSFKWRSFEFATSARGNPFEAPTAWVTPLAGDASQVLASGWVGSTGGKVRRGGSRAEIPLHLRGSWVFAARVGDVRIQKKKAAQDYDPPGQPSPDAQVGLAGMLYAFIEDGAEPGHEAALLSEDIGRDLPGVVADLVAAVPDESPPPGQPSDPGTPGSEPPRPDFGDVRPPPLPELAPPPIGEPYPSAGPGGSTTPRPSVPPNRPTEPDPPNRPSF